ncbi:hypothetical protein FJ955_01970 [Mesorhizobium sp. B2-2-2]|nr:hypothetical protein [Mesorhizobium sp. B2-2-2]TPM34105.1 hypothetical protein FJ955_01970 [Mesorhizobium sp. B2-2-2]
MAKKETTAAPKNVPTHEAFVIDGEGEKAFWTRIGCAWQHNDTNGFNITLTAIPVNGRIVLRAKKESGQ